jgi:hypothetical protein
MVYACKASVGLRTRVIASAFLSSGPTWRKRLGEGNLACMDSAGPVSICVRVCHVLPEV